MKRRAYLAGFLGLAAGCTSAPTDGSADSDSRENESDSEDPADGPTDPLSVGEAFVTDSGLSVTLEDVVLTDRYETVRGEHPHSVGEMFVLARVAAENVGDEPRSLPSPADVRLVGDGAQFEPIGFNASSPLTEPVEGDRYKGIDDARAGVSDAGWLAFQVPRSTSSATLSWLDETGDAGELRWAIDVEDEAADLPDLRFAGVSLPDSATVGDSVDVEIAVENRGGREGTIELVAWIEGVLDDERYWTLTVPPGETVSRTVTHALETAGELVVHVETFDVTKRLVVDPEPDSD